MESIIDDLQRENAELRKQLEGLPNPLDDVVEIEALLDVIAQQTKSRIVTSMTPAEIGPHMREVALHCIRLARQASDAIAAQQFENISIELAERANRLEAIFTIAQERE